MAFAFKISGHPMMISHDEMWPQDVENHIKMLQIGKNGYEMVEKDKFKVLWNKTLSKQIILAAANTAKFKMNLITQTEEKNDNIRIRRKQR